jgi:hypothetical protein
MIEDVERFRPKLIPKLFPYDVAVLVQASVQNPEAWSDDYVSSRVSKGSRGGQGEARGIEELGYLSGPVIRTTSRHQFRVFSTVARTIHSQSRQVFASVIWSV